MNNENILILEKQAQKHDRYCAAALLELRQTSQSAQAAQLLQANQPLISKLRDNGGLTSVSLLQMPALARAVEQEVARGLAQPEWLDPATREQLFRLADAQLQLQHTAPLIRRSRAQPILDALRAELMRKTLNFEPADLKKCERNFSQLSKTKK